MSKRWRGKRGKRRPGSPFADYNISGLSQHHRKGTTLVPPLAQLPKMGLSSWSDQHMPEMLWASLLAATFGRNEYLACFRRIAILSRSWFLREDGQGQGPPNTSSQENGINFTIVVDHTKLSELDDAAFRAFLDVPLSHPLGYAALRPLLLINGLPGLERWKRELAAESTQADWATLARAVALTLNHQSEHSTDIRWLKVMVPLISGWLKFPESMRERLEELRLFPDRGDMRLVRPSIRSTEMSLRRSPPSAWIGAFWTQVFTETRCIDPSDDEDYSFKETLIDPEALYVARDEVIDRFRRCMTAERSDPKLDGAFGFTLYALSLVEEIGMHRMHNRIAGRVMLRALVEVCITFRYLAHKDSPKMWQAFRVHGAGQAKLAFLKAQELEGDLPPFIDEEALHAIANEDLWQEYLNIDVGHWANSNLRKMAIECGAKDLYDQYYDWTSGFTHGHWGAVRDSNFVNCHNPLHRLHRIPRRMHRMLNSVDVDAAKIANEVLRTLEYLYPEQSAVPRVTFIEMKDPPNDGTDAARGQES